MSWINYLYVPCEGIKLEFDEFDLYPPKGETTLFIRALQKGEKKRLFLKHIEFLSDFSHESFRRIRGIDFEIIIKRDEKEDLFHLDSAHAFLFLLMIRTGGWVNAPAILSASLLDEPDFSDPHVSCESFIDTVPAGYGDFSMSLEDIRWIHAHITAALQFMHEPRFQNAMQALNSYHCIPYANTCLLTAWSGLEALFGTANEISFRLSLYIANYLKSGAEKELLFKKLRASYAARSRIAHGQSTKAKLIAEHSEFTRDILRMCLVNCLEEKIFPDTNKLVFG